jgi:hypothetical protein
MVEVGDVLGSGEAVDVHLEVLGHGGDVVVVVLGALEVGVMCEKVDETEEGLLEDALTDVCSFTRSEERAREKSTRSVTIERQKAGDDSPGETLFALAET